MSIQSVERSVNKRTAQLEKALRRARAQDAEYRDSRAKVNDLRFLRLEALRDQLLKVADHEELSNAFITLRAIPGDPPRLIIDDLSHIVMEPDPRTYTFIHDGPESRKVLIESEHKVEVEAKVTEYIAHKILETQRRLPLPDQPKKSGKNSRVGGLALLMFWLAGAITGAAAAYLYVDTDAFGLILKLLSP